VKSQLLPNIQDLPAPGLTQAPHVKAPTMAPSPGLEPRLQFLSMRVSPASPELELRLHQFLLKRASPVCKDPLLRSLTRASNTEKSKRGKPEKSCEESRLAPRPPSVPSLVTLKPTISDVLILYVWIDTDLFQFRSFIKIV